METGFKPCTSSPRANHQSTFSFPTSVGFPSFYCLPSLTSMRNAEDAQSQSPERAPPLDLQMRKAGPRAQMTFLRQESQVAPGLQPPSPSGRFSVYRKACFRAGAPISFSMKTIRDSDSVTSPSSLCLMSWLCEATAFVFHFIFCKDYNNVLKVLLSISDEVTLG